MGAAIRAMQRASARELAARRAAVVAAVREVAPLRFVNGGGTGSVERTAAEAAVTEVAAGSGLYGPTLFDAYGGFTPQPAALFALPVVRRPDARTATLLGGGYPASGAAGADRLPAPHLPDGPEARRPGGRRRGPDAAARPGRRGAAGRRPRVDAPRQGGRAVRALQRAAPGARRRARGDGADVPRRRARRFCREPANGGLEGWVRTPAAGVVRDTSNPTPTQPPLTCAALEQAGAAQVPPDRLARLHRRHRHARARGRRART